MMIVPSIGTSIVALRLTCARCHHACNSHCWLRSHFSLSFVWFWFWLCVFSCFCCVVFGLLSCSPVLLLGQFLDCVLVHNRHFCGFQQGDSPACKLQFNCLPRLNVCNDLAEAMKALDGKIEADLRTFALPCIWCE